MMRLIRSLVAAAGLMVVSGVVVAGGVSVEDAWVRGTVAAQKATGAFMRLTAEADTRLVGAQCPVADVTEVHEMVMENDVMKMRPLPTLALPAGQPVDLKPGGYHIMLIGLKGPLEEGAVVPITLRFAAADGSVAEQVVEAPVRALTAGGMGHGAMHGK
jgi:copper(I)-binding protein